MVTFSCFLKLLNYSLMEFYGHTILKKAFETHFQFISTLGDNYYLLILFFFFFLVILFLFFWPHSMRDLSSLTRDRTSASCRGSSYGILTIGHQGNPQKLFLTILSCHIEVLSTCSKCKHCFFVLGLSCSHHPIPFC